MAAEGARQEAVVTEWKTSGYGFLQAQDGRRAYVHKSACEDDHLLQGEVVSCVIVADAQNSGKWAAAAVQRTSEAPSLQSTEAPVWRDSMAAPSITPPGLVSAMAGVGPALGLSLTGGKEDEERVEALVAEWVDGKGYGFLHASDGRRAYVHRSACAGEALQAGEAVTAVIVPDTQNPGKWQAQAVLRSFQLAEARGRPAPSSDAWGGFASQGQAPAAWEEPSPGWDGAAAAATGERQEAVVVEWRSAGYGFVQASDGRRAYVHTSSCNGTYLEEGETISAVIIPDDKNPGKWQAQFIQRGPLVEVVPGADQQEAVVTEWKSSGYGFILVADGRRAYVHNSTCNGEHLEEGEAIFCTIVADLQNPGKWAASSVQRRPPQQQAQQRYHSPASQQWPGVQHTPHLVPPLRQQQQHQGVAAGGASMTAAESAAAAAVAALARLSAATAGAESGSGAGAGAGDRVEGVVAEWVEGKGYGFIHSSDGRRAYVHKSACPGETLQMGETVSAIFVPDARNLGKWQAQSISRGPLGEDGVVTEWKDEGGYGFLQLEDGRRAFIHRSILEASSIGAGGGGLIVGTKLRVTVKPDARNAGKWCVGSVRSLQDEDAQGDQGQEGICSEWNEAKGFGFLAMDDGTRAYIHRSAFGGEGQLAPGLRVRVILRPDVRNPGKLMVGEVLSVGEEQLGAGGACVVVEPAIKRPRLAE